MADLAILGITRCVNPSWPRVFLLTCLDEGMGAWKKWAHWNVAPGWARVGGMSFTFDEPCKLFARALMALLLFLPPSSRC